MKLRWRRRASLGLACALVTFGLLFPGVALADPEPVGGGAEPLGGEAPDEAAARLEESAVAAGALGIYIDDQTAEYVVVGWHDSRPSLEAANLARNGLPVRIETRNVTRSDVDAITKRLTGLRTDQSLAGKSYRFGIDPELGTVVLVSDAPKSEFADVLEEFPELIEYRQGGPFTRLTRSNDAEPHWGGAEITDFERNCTSGYTVRKTSNGLNHMVSAGHCGSVNEAIAQPDTGFSYGTVKFKAAFPATDALLIGGETFSGRIYIGNEAGIQMPVSNAGNPVLSATYCFSGSETNESCGHVVNDTDEIVCFEDGCTQHLVVFTGSSLGGDSGGPIFIKVGTTSVLIRGHIVGGSPTETFGHKWTTVRDGFGVTIVTAS